MASSRRRPPSAAPSAPPVRYYPRRIRRAAGPAVLSPSAALRLGEDPQRAAKAARTAERRELVVAQHPVGRVRAWWHRIFTR